LLERIRAIYRDQKGIYGSPRIQDALRDEGIRCGCKRVARLMRENGIRAKTTPRFKVTTRRSQLARYSPDLVGRQFTVGQPNRIWVSDMTYVWSKQGWSYLAVVLDLYSRRVVGWELGARSSARLISGALQRALEGRSVNEGLVVHSDRGGQYVSREVQEVLDGHRCVPSHGLSCYDNAVAESFFHTIKTEHIRFEHYATREEVRSSLFEYIEVFYNRQRKHSTLGMKSPVQFEEQHVSP
jgi:transposase InsO family protein